MLNPRSTTCANIEVETERCITFGGVEEDLTASHIRSLSDCVDWILKIAKSVEEELWLPFALRGAIFEGVSSLCRLAETGRLSRDKAIAIVEQLEVCCLFYEDLSGRSRTLELIAELGSVIGLQREWTFSR
ncbi:hypothetical protein [Pelagicoccus sp. SDUM812002]|uniref:hypothetical protein n=1 Tax=Pelagicoccus sp. SDUM812002 TaxID=3041266 RepID=UPI00280FB0CE|nr:hypothetical protein [Pelagicoccus sp. SDUM812002]MDQ8186217.1 hypothetical protein [Pelagicoccus sp. SDUM812002]